MAFVGLTTDATKKSTQQQKHKAILHFKPSPDSVMQLKTGVVRRFSIPASLFINADQKRSRASPLLRWYHASRYRCIHTGRRIQKTAARQFNF
ncbi:MAG: hypothetical protein CMM01_01055 [Rhodopirellula sp.]|nr:hypothetical protein [Rhodopirellula sp.]